MIQLHISTHTELIKYFLPGMIERKYGKILNLGSIGSFVPGPYNAVYCATKSYILSLSEALCTELKGTGVSVTALCPGGTDTEFGLRFNNKEKPTAFFKVMNSESVAKIGYKAFMKGKRIIIPGLYNKAQVFTSRFVPRNILLAIIKRMMVKYK